MSLNIFNTPQKNATNQAQLVGTIKCQFKLPGLVRTDIPKQKGHIEKRLIHRLKNLDIHCENQLSALLIQCNRETEHVNFIIEVKVYYIQEAQDTPLAAARWFVKTGRSLSKIILGSSSLSSVYAGLSTNIKPSYLFMLEDALDLYEQQPKLALA
jgi:hypothetical protein